MYIIDSKNTHNTTINELYYNKLKNKYNSSSDSFINILSYHKYKIYTRVQPYHIFNIFLAFSNNLAKNENIILLSRKLNFWVYLSGVNVCDLVFVLFCYFFFCG